MTQEVVGKLEIYLKFADRVILKIGQQDQSFDMITPSLEEFLYKVKDEIVNDYEKKAEEYAKTKNMNLKSIVLKPRKFEIKIKHCGKWIAGVVVQDVQMRDIYNALEQGMRQIQRTLDQARQGKGYDDNVIITDDKKFFGDEDVDYI